MILGSRVKPEWRVEGESHSLADVVSPRCASSLSWQDCTAYKAVVHPSESIMGLFKGAQRI